MKQLSKIIYITFCPLWLLNISIITLKFDGNPENFLRKSKPWKLWQESYLMVMM